MEEGGLDAAAVQDLAFDSREFQRLVTDEFDPEGVLVRGVDVPVRPHELA